MDEALQPSNHVLVVDDDRDTREIVARALSRDNLAVTQVDGGTRPSPCWKSGAST